MPSKNYTFKAAVYKTGINFAVDVPVETTSALQSVKGYIRVIGTVNGVAFTKSLVPVKNAQYRLYINTITLKDIRNRVGETMIFVIAQDESDPTQEHPMSVALKDRLQQNGLLKAFHELSASRQKEILRYLNQLKTPDVLERQTQRLISQLQSNFAADTRIP